MHFQANLEGSLWGKTRTGSVCTFSGKSGAEFARKEKTERNSTRAFAGGGKEERNSMYCAGAGATWSGLGTDGRGSLQGAEKIKI